MTAAAPIVTQTEISMLSAALVLCGEKPLNSLADPRYGAQVGAALFDMIYETEIQSNRWRFACKKGQLTQIVGIPLNEWQYAYQVPPDCLQFIGFWGVSPAGLYEIYGNVIYTNTTANPGVNAGTLTAEYMFKPDPGTIPSYFSLLVTLALAQHMCKPVTESDSARTKCEQAYIAARNRAMFIDANARPNRPLQHRPFIAVR